MYPSNESCPLSAKQSDKERLSTYGKIIKKRFEKIQDHPMEAEEAPWCMCRCMVIAVSTTHRRCLVCGDLVVRGDCVPVPGTPMIAKVYISIRECTGVSVYNPPPRL